MKNGWLETTLGEACILRSGTTLPKAIEKSSGEIPYLKVADMNISDNLNGVTCSSRYVNKSDVNASNLLPVGTTIFPKRGGAIFTNKKLLTSRVICADLNIMGVTPKTGLLSELLYYYFLCLDLREINSGSSIPQINNYNVEPLPISFPESLPEQRRIVGILDEAFAGIAIAKANAEKNLQNARALFKSHQQAVFNKCGEGWVEKRFSEVCEISSVLVDPRLPEYQELLHVGGANIETKTGGLSDLKTANEEGLKSGKFLFDETMVLYSKIRPYLMKVARPDFKGLCSADIYPLSAKERQINRDFLFHLLLSPKFTEYAIAGSARAGMPKVNRDHLFSFRVPLPPLIKQKHYAEQLDALHEETQRLESLYQRKLAALDELKKSLLHQAFSGQL